MKSRAKGAVHSAVHLARPGVVLPFGVTVWLYGGTDKSTHGYAQAYGRHLSALRYRTNRVLEIGVGGWTPTDHFRHVEPGGSLRVWRDYLPRSIIVGLDIEHKNVRLGSRVKFIQGDQSSSNDLARVVDALGAPPNIVVDDGSHLAGHARASFSYLFPLMPPGSLYVIEDLHTSYWDSAGGARVAPESTAVGLAKDLIDAVQVQDPTFVRRPDRGQPPEVIDVNVAELHVYPGICFIVKSARLNRE
ncbi:MAG: hypothetical protein ABI862_06240 [Ilumatobacteraceae bacterium]